MEEKMKDSGIKWIGQIPENWGIKKLKYCVRKKITDGPHETPVFIDDGVIFLSVDSIQDGKIKFENTRYISYEDAKKYDKKCKLEKNDVLIGKAASTGKIAIVDKDVYFQVWSPLAVVKTNSNILYSNYLRYYLLSPSGQENIDNFCTMNTQKNIAMEDIERLLIVIPSLEEQKKIAKFLDKKCADIDEIIAKTEKQIKTLEQYKKSIITEAVTKGFDNNLEYINNTFYKVKPENWKLSRIKDVLSLLTDYTANGSFQSLADNVEYLDYEAYARVIRLTDLRVNMENAGIYVNEHAYNYLRKSSLFGGEILVANVGAYAGIFCEMPKCKYKATLGPNMFLLKTNKLMLQHYLYYIGLSYIVSKQLIIKATASAQPKLNKQDVKTIYILVPPISEQKEIIEFLDNRCEEIDQIIYKQKEGLKILKKYKQSLIYEYVTGKKRV